ncbi:MAG: DUF354 domain-containing protein [Minwuiales bacterium]|nr:DUF354 domain-containing protein [Minwuiales bacterium]
MQSRQPCIILDSHHPKHYLAVRNLARRCENHGIRVIWTIHDKDVMVDLMREHGHDPLVLTKGRRTLLSKLGELLVYDWKLAQITLRNRPLALMGKTVTLAHVGRLLNVPCLIINDDSAAANPQYRYLAYPFVDRIITAECLGEDYGDRQRTYPGLMELAYLHPNVFTPNPEIRAHLGVPADRRLFLLRLAAFDAYHDVGGAGLSRGFVNVIVRRLEAEGQVFIVSEHALDRDLAKYRLPTPASRLHDVIAACDLVLGDGLTVCVEAALLGVPAIAIGSYIGKHTYSEEIEKRFGLMFGFRPDCKADILARLDSLLAHPDLRAEWSTKRQAMLDRWVDPTDIYWEELYPYIAPALRQSAA